MTLPAATALFAAHPKSSAVLSALFLLLGLACISGLVPTSPNRIDFPGRWWVLACIAWLAAVFVGHAALKGFRAAAGKAKR
ncbi:MAG: hypothetical protein ABI300_03870 [Rhodanobacter sp.]